jgi:preprotein translocase subunit SecE
VAKINPLEFAREVREETSKVTWPTRRETMISTVMVLIMVALASVFFFLVDSILHYGVNAILGL